MRRAHLAHQIDEARNRVALDIEFGTDCLLYIADIVVADMAGIGTRVDGDAVGTEVFDCHCRLDHIGQSAATRVANHGNLVYIDA